MKRTAIALASITLAAASRSACTGNGDRTCGDTASQVFTRGSGGPGHVPHGSHGGKSTSKSKTHRGGPGHVPHLNRPDMDNDCDD